MAGLSSPERRHLAQETIMRIEVSLSSRRSSVVVFNTTARLYSLDHEEWTSMAYGAPCILLLKETAEADSPFVIKLVIAELESGINLWEEIIWSGTEYTEQNATFHTFVGSSNRQTLAVQFADPDEAKSLLASLKQFYNQKQQIDKLIKNRPPAQTNKPEKTKKLTKKRLSKYDISAPCNFKHVSGLTNQRTDVCTQEIRGTIQRRLRSQSMSSLETNKTKLRPSLPSTSELTNESVYDNDAIPQQAVSQFDLRKPVSPRRATSPPSMDQSTRSRYHSLRMTKKKPLVGHMAQSVDDLALDEQAAVGPAPTHFRYSMNMDSKEGYMPQSWLDRSSSPSSLVGLHATDYPGPTTPPAEYSNVSGYRYPSHQLHTSPSGLPSDREHMYINASPEMAPMDAGVQHQQYNGGSRHDPMPQQQYSEPHDSKLRPQYNGRPGAYHDPPTRQQFNDTPLPNAHLTSQQQFIVPSNQRGPVQVSNPMPPPNQRMSNPMPPPNQRAPVPVSNPMPPPNQRAPVPVSNPIPPPNQRGPVPVSNPMPPPNQRAPVPVSNPMPPSNHQYHQGRPISGTNQGVPMQIARTPHDEPKSSTPVPPQYQQQLANGPDLPLANHQPRRLMSNPAGSQRRQLQRKASWLDNYTPMPMSPEHKASAPNNTSSATVSRQLSSPTHHQPTATSRQPTPQNYQTHEVSRSQSVTDPVQHSRAMQPYSSNPPSGTVSQPLVNQAPSDNVRAMSPNRLVPMQVPQVPSSPPASPPPNAATPFDSEMDDLTDELSRLLHEFDYLISSPNKDKPTTLV